MFCNWARMLRRARGAQLLLRIKIRRSLFLSEQAPYRSVFLPAPVNCGARPCKVRTSSATIFIQGRSFAPQGTSFARSDSGQKLRPHTPPASRLMFRIS